MHFAPCFSRPQTDRLFSSPGESAPTLDRLHRNATPRPRSSISMWLGFQTLGLEGVVPDFTVETSPSRVPPARRSLREFFSRFVFARGSSKVLSAACKDRGERIPSQRAPIAAARPRRCDAANYFYPSCLSFLHDCAYINCRTFNT